ncbi:E3 ubiquitin-protein ligase [Hordeum vulgare]|nr:E3 ubiquitin-protein ligase [Hordeum vulgare]
MRMPTTCTIKGNGDAGATEAPEQGVKMETKVSIIDDEVSLHLDIVNRVVLPQPEPEPHNDSANDSGDDSDNHSGNDTNDDGQPVSHLYPLFKNSSD